VQSARATKVLGKFAVVLLLVFENHLVAKTSTFGAMPVKGNKFTVGMIGSWNGNFHLDFATMERWTLPQWKEQ
jgi:hypothetical protein